MHAETLSRWLPRGAAFGVAALLGASLVAWSLRWPQPAAALPQATAASDAPAPESPNTQALAGLLGAASPTTGTAASADTAQLQLLGVVASNTTLGSALIAVDGAAPQAFAVGDRVREGLVLQSLAPRHVQLGATLGGAAMHTLALPPPPEAPGVTPVRP